MSREAIYAALFTRVSAAAGFVTASRIFRPFTEVEPAERPAIFQVQDTQTPNQSRQRPPIWTLRASLFIYVWQPDPNTTAASELNTLVDAVEAALAPNPVTQVQDLGGLVSHCWIEGEVDIFDGAIAEQAVAVIPIAMLLGGSP